MNSMSLRHPLEPSSSDDIDWRIATACRLAQNHSAGMEEALTETPVMTAAHAYAQALMDGDDVRRAEAAYLAALNDLVTAFMIRLRNYRTSERLP